MTNQVRWACVLVCSAVCLSGCGRSDLPELGTVEGTVTMDGKPMAGVMVQFHPEAGGRPGTAVTDSEGKYALEYVDGIEGAPVGPNRVEINTVWPNGEPGPGEKETISTKYNSQSTLKETVESGHNTFDFKLESSAQ